MKRIVVALLAVCILPCALLAGCGTSNQGATASSSAASVESAASASSEASSESSASSAAAQQQMPEAQEIALPQTVTKQDYEMELSRAWWTEGVSEKVSDSTTIGFLAKSNGGDVLLVIGGTFSQLGAGDYLTAALELSIETSDGTILEGHGWNPVGTVLSGTTGNLYLVVVMTDEQRESFSSGVATLTVKRCTGEGRTAEETDEILDVYRFNISAQDISAE